MQTHLRLAPPPVTATQVKLDLSGITLVDFMDAARSVFFNKAALTSLDKVVAMPRVTIREKIQSILSHLRNLKTSTFRSILGKSMPRVEIIVTFLAMLELVKRHIVSAEQTTLFGDIDLTPLTDMNGVEELPFEFDEEHSLEDEE